ncbi:MAG: Nif3-like dinuclear metal center hexameric protein [Pirellulaceae bacterium]|nr:Nif3-like dinuclear metal center hexameric protein [Pirellulaceae bacterium]MDP7019263.1 Nif3-like dinuclear metal center hexameric protein [Pirellulaceae bacterium]
MEIDRIVAFLENFAPLELAEDWDNVGLLVGRRGAQVERVMTCLTITPASAAEAIERKADLIVAHHPLPFRSIKRLTDETTVGRLLLDLVESSVAIFSPHTAFDSAASGINQLLAKRVGLTEIRPLRPLTEDPAIGSGRWGRFSEPLDFDQFAERVKSAVEVAGMHVAGRRRGKVAAVAVACGSAGEFLEPARQLGCDALITGETNFHTCLEAEARDIVLALPGHYATERFGVEQLAQLLGDEFGGLDVWPSERECDPVVWH